MSYKIKSLLYLLAFIASTVLYISLEPENNPEQNVEHLEPQVKEIEHLDSKEVVQSKEKLKDLQ
ncbi:hypothetical protein SAMN04487911_108115 [Arenibacter nanhaiticus]|uniref:Uncharacterized protein n=1 Tax=Arenibacter nanhaiticus TaxID=558155 RepID=A0A1M6FFT4_9FLAO|nr:hypothetical protein [Arenibacter nanhaiticus]SHI96525.1 hypothetical protein SAMN04487911_108115 [Arenibacter nanhaiticus]